MRVLESSLPDGAALATRLYTPEGFAMTAGVWCHSTSN